MSLIFLALVVLGMFSGGFRSVSAQIALGVPQLLPGDSSSVVAAAGAQERPQLSRGADSYLSIWTDSRTALSGTSVTSGTGLGSLQDIYAARIGADGQVIDTTPIIVSQEQHEQIQPRVGWNGQNWLVSWLTKRPRDQFSHTYDLVAARISPTGAVLDPAPIVIRADVSIDSKPAAVIEDGAGNWVVTFESFLPQEGVNIPRGVLAARISDGGVVLDPGGRLIYNHHNQFMGDSHIARAGDRYLLTFVDVATSHAVMGLLLDASLNPLRNGPEQLGGGGTKPRVASNGETWFVINRATGTLVNRNGDAVGSTSFINPVSSAEPVVCWDGQLWFVAFSTNYNAATQTYLNQDDLYVSRISPTGALLDPSGLPVKQGADYQVYAAIAPGIGGGVQVAWQELEKVDVSTARVTREGAVGADVALALGAPRQSRVRMATNGSGFLAVFRSETSNAARILGQHLNADGTPADAEPFVISNDPSSGNPSVGWDGASYLAVWDQTTATGRQTFGAVVPAAGTTPGAPFFIANGFLPDAAGLNGTFLVVNILQETSQIKTTQGTLVSGAGAPLGAAFKIQRAFNTWPRVAAFAGRWLAVWEFHGNHDGSPGSIYGSFVKPDGTFGAPFLAGDVSSDATPHLAVAGDQALVVWSNGDIHARRLNADGSSPEPQSGAPVSAAPGLQALPSVAWDGDEYVVTWVDQRNELFPQQPRGDIYAARVAPTNVRFEEFPVANSALPEDSPFVISTGGLTLLSYSKFNPQSPYAALRVTTRAARFGAPPGVRPALAPGNLSATQVNEGLGTVTLQWADRTDNEEGFKLEMRSGTGAFNQIKLLPANATTTTVINLSPNEPFIFRLRAYNAAGDSDYSNEAGAPAVVMTRFTPNTFNEPATVQLAATASDPDGVARVDFLTSPDGVSYSLLATDAQAPYSYQWQNVPRGYYFVQARAYDSVGSHTTSLSESFVVYGNPDAAITSPASGAAFIAGSPVTINATAQTRNGNGEYLLRMDFYANSTLIGTVQGHYESYQFTWANPPTGNYQLTARPTSSLNLTGSSAPVQITVGTPGVNVSGRVTDGTMPLYGVTIALSGAQNARATTDTDGNYFFTSLAPGGSYAVTPQASGYTFNPASLSFNNLAASQTANFTGAPGSPVTNDPNAAPIYSQLSDGRAVEGPSSKTPTGQQVDGEIADDFDLTAEITRVRVAGTRGDANMPPNPDYRGIYVRFYEGTSGAPGAQQAEYYLPKGAPGVSFDAARPSTFDVTLPTPFNATGRHFVSVQPVYVGTETWWPKSGSYPNVRGSAWLKRNRLANGAWAVGGGAGNLNDMAFDLFGKLLSTPRIDTVSPNPVPRSGLVRISGAYFGTAQGSSQLTIDGKQPQHIAQWSDNLIVAYVPETSALGDVPLSLTSSGKTGTATLNVTTRPTDGRIRWRFTVAGDYVLHRSGIGPDGTIYLNDVNGRLYALSPDGGLKWVFRAGATGYVGPVTVGADGTVYVAGLVPRNPSVPCSLGDDLNSVDGIFAINPDGTQKWIFDKTCQGIIAGPNVGPDGKIYAVSDTLGIGAFALKPDGSLAYAVDNFAERGPLGEEIVFGPAAPGLAPTQQYFQFGNSGLFGYTLQGQRVFSYSTSSKGQPAVGLLTGSVYSVGFPIGAGYRLFSLTPQGALRWQSAIQPVSGLSAPDLPPSESALYVVQDQYRLHRVNPGDGSVVWTFIDGDILFDPIASPDDRLVLMGGRLAFGQPGFFEALSKDGNKLWKQFLADEPGLAPHGQVVPISRARFTADGQTAYIAADVAGDNPTASNSVYSFFYALDTSDKDLPINQPPKVTILSPLPNSNVPNRTLLDFKASVQDDGKIDRVEFLYNHNGSQTRVGTDTTPDADGNYGIKFSPPGPGVYGLFAAAYDVGGLRSESQIAAITVSNQSPTISWVSPANNSTFAAPASITLTARAADSDGAVSIVHFNSNQVGDLGQDTTADAQGNYQIEWTNPPQGAHELYAWATDNDGTRRAATINITVGLTPTPTPTPTATPTPTPTPSPTPIGAAPTVSITSPADRASFAPGASVVITANASDSDGRITRVEFWHDGVSGPAASDANAPYSTQISWSSPTILKLYVVAYDDAGNRTQSAPIFVYFEDPAGNLSITGRITHQQSTPANPVYLANALVKLGFANYAYRATRTDANGYYTFTGLSRGGRYKVEPSESGYAFYPPSASYEGLVSNVTQDFIADGPLPPSPTPTPTPGASALAWERFYNSPHNSSDGGGILATDGQGNTYVAGTSYAPAGGDTNISLVKYAPDGTQLWQREHAGRGDYKDWATSVRADSEGNVYVSGTVWGGSAYEYDIVTIKYTADGTELWARVYNGPLGRWDTSAAMEIDNAGNIIVGGYSQTSDTSGRLYDEFIVIKYNAVGGLVWEQRNSVNRRGDRLVALTVDSDRNVYATGEAWVGHADGSLLEDVVTVKYGPDGTKLWASQFNRAASTVALPQPLPNNPASRARPGGLRLDPATGDLYVFGSSEFGTTGLDYLLLKYNTATGELRWNRNWAGPRSDTARALAVDAQGNAYLTGESYDGDFESATAIQSTDVATVKFAPDGVTVWERFYRGFPGKTDAGRRIVVDPVGSAYVAFYSEGFFTSDTGVVKYHADGTEQWVYRYDNPAHTSDQVADLVLDAASNLYVVGQASITNTGGSETIDLVTFKLAPATSALNTAPEVRADVQGAATTGSPVTVNATATDLDGTVARVDFFDGTTQIGTDASGPFSVQWSPTATGAHAITALATDNKGASRTSKTQLVTVEGAQQVYVIAGQLAANGSPLAGASVALGGTHSAQTQTGADGRYAFTNLPASGNYTVTPSVADYTFTPTTRSFSNLTENQTADFTASSVPASIQFGAASYDVGEGSGSAAIIVTRSINTSTAVSIGYSTGSGTATAGDDFTATSGTLSFAAGEVSKTVTVPVLNDAAVESAETFNVTLGSLGGGAVVGSPSSTTVTIIDNDSCSYQLSQTSRNSPAAGESVTISVTAPAGCAWTAASNASFISLISGAAGSGNGEVTFTMAANSAATQRTGMLTIAGHTFTVTQASVTCAFTLSSVSQSFAATGGTGSINLMAAAADCDWGAASDASWITIGSSASGSGSGVVNFFVAANPASTPRTGTLTIAGQTVTIMQAGVACSYAVSQQVPSEVPATGGQGSFQMVAPQGCAWTVSSLVPWVTITSGSGGTGTGSVTFTVATNTGAARTGQILHTDDSFINVRQAAATASLRLEFSAVSVSESARRAELKVMRVGNTSAAASVTLQTVDDPEAIPCATLNGKAYARCDYATTIETVSWEAGDAQPKTVQIPLIDDARSEGAETLRIRLSDPQGGVLGDSDTATLTITDSGVAEGANPIFTTSFFVRQQYLDFLSREPEAGEPWSRVLSNCSDVNNNPLCDRILVSQSFFGSPEFRLKGFFVYNFYSVAFNRRPTYEEIIPDMRRVTGTTEQEVYQKRAAFPVGFTNRAEFKTLYDSLSDAGFVNKLLDRYGLQQITTLDPTNPEGGTKVALTRADLISRLGASGAQLLTRAQVLRAIVESNEVGAAEYNRAFVAMQYFGYLRRSPEEEGYQAWLKVINADPNNIRIMVDGFMNSTEYRLRFGTPNQ